MENASTQVHSPYTRTQSNTRLTTAYKIRIAVTVAREGNNTMSSK